ncbi:MAG: hypothetical protein ACYCX4_08490 [Bacillota bacterium]
MPTINLQDKIFGTLEEHELQTFLSACDSFNLGYIQRDETSWQLLPQLPGTTLVIKPLETSPVLHSLIQNLKQQLTWHGALAIVEPGLKLNIDLFKVTRAQIAISFIDQGLYPDHYDMYFYYSLRAKSESIDFIGGLVKQLSNKNNNLTYTLASYWKHLTYFKYRKIIFSQVPTVLVVFTNIDALEKFMNDVTDCMLNSIIDIYGNKISRDELDKLAECITMATKINPTTIPDVETPSQKEAPTECAPNDVIEATEIPIEKSETTITATESTETPKPNTVSKEANPEHETIMPLNETPENIKNSKTNNSAPPRVERANENTRKINTKSTAKPHTTVQNAPRSHTTMQNAPRPHTTVQNAPRSHTTVQNAPRSHTTVQNAPRPHTTVQNAPGPHTTVQNAPGPDTTSIVKNAPGPDTASIVKNALRPDTASIAKNAPGPDTASIVKNAPRPHTTGIVKNAPKPHTTGIVKNAPKPHYGKVNPLIPPGDGAVNYFTRPSRPVKHPQYNLNNMKRITLAAQLLNTQRYQLSDFSKRLTGNKMTISLFNSQAENIISNLINTPNRNTAAARSTFYQPPTRPKEQKQENPVQINDEKPVSIEEKTQQANLEPLKVLEKVLES